MAIGILTSNSENPPAMHLAFHFLLRIGGTILHSATSILKPTGIAGRSKSLAQTWVANHEYEELTHEIL